ncbi:MAG: chemotaxis response regulator protein-glutamate methylesterase [Planctomycetota bacterium]
MATPTRVLVVDDSVVIRRILGQILDGEPDLEPLRPAANGKIGLARIEEDKPDIVILDVEMPVLDGLQTLAQIRKDWPSLPVIMFSTLTERGATTTLDALSLGASDYLAKPTAAVAVMSSSAEQIRTDLCAKIRALCPANQPMPLASARPRSRPAAAPASAGPIEIVTVGVSTGGPNALAEFLPQFPADFPVPIVIVQHMPPMFTRLLAERLDRDCKLSVREGEAGQKIGPGEIWLAPGDKHMVIDKRLDGARIDLNLDPPECSCRPAADVLFRSVAQAYGGASLGVVLTGMGQDGLRGSEAMTDAGASIIAQDEASCVVWGMPAAVTNAGLATEVLPLAQIAGAVCRRVERSRDASKTPAGGR